LFTDYLSINSALPRDSGENIRSSNALAAITLMTAMSKPEEKETIIQLVTNILDDNSIKSLWASPSSLAVWIGDGRSGRGGQARRAPARVAAGRVAVSMLDRWSSILIRRLGPQQEAKCEICAFEYERHGFGDRHQ